MWVARRRVGLGTEMWHGKSKNNLSPFFCHFLFLAYSTAQRSAKIQIELFSLSPIYLFIYSSVYSSIYIYLLIYFIYLYFESMNFFFFFVYLPSYLHFSRFPHFCETWKSRMPHVENIAIWNGSKNIGCFRPLMHNRSAIFNIVIEIKRCNRGNRFRRMSFLIVSSHEKGNRMVSRLWNGYHVSVEWIRVWISAFTSPPKFVIHLGFAATENFLWGSFNW